MPDSWPRVGSLSQGREPRAGVRLPPRSFIPLNGIMGRKLGGRQPPHLGLEMEGGEVGAAAGGPKQREGLGSCALALRRGAGGAWRLVRRGQGRWPDAAAATSGYLSAAAGAFWLPAAPPASRLPTQTLRVWKRLVARLERTACGSMALARLSTPHGMPAGRAQGGAGGPVKPASTSCRVAPPAAELSSAAARAAPSGFLPASRRLPPGASTG